MDNAAQSTTYTALARRYRPQGFDEVIGQEHIAQTLRNSILQNRVGHAYLFTGARGVGKTSTARIFAKALNCPDSHDGMPCNRCDVCESVAAGRDVDVLEIDGASNTGVDNIRDLRANANVMSMRSKYKIYIIDEVHMLSKSAFAALLKTLEEPPPNVKFFFCTTDPQKLPDTILSRCQRFDFGTISLPKIIDRLASIAEQEKIAVEPAALELVARRAAGSMRDSQSIFDQLLAGADKSVTAADVHRLLGTASDERLMELFAAIIGRNRPETLSLFSHALAEGAQLGEMIDQILNYLRDLMVLAAEATNIPLLSVSETNRESLGKQASSWGLNTVVAALQIASETKLKMQRVTSGRAFVELALIRLTLLEQLQSLDALLAELSAPCAANVVIEKKKPDLTALPVATERTPSAAVVESAASVAAEPVIAEPATESPQVEAAELLRSHETDSDGTDTTNGANSTSNFEPGKESVFWSQVLAELGDDLGPHVRKATAVAIRGPNRLEFSFPKSYLFAKSFCEKPDIRARLEKTVSRIAGKPVSVGMSVMDEPTTDEPKTPPPATRRLDLSTGGDPFVEKAIELFGGKVMKKDVLVRPTE